MSHPISERAIVIEPHGLIGVVTYPLTPQPGLPRVIVLNGGILPRSGQGRIYVTLSRRLAALGHEVLRFDMSGIGDSPSRGDGLPPLEAAAEDIREAVDWFATEDSGVVIMGLCDGATLAAYHASVDPRVVGAMLIDPLVPRTVLYRLLHTWRRITRPKTWFDPQTGAIRALTLLSRRRIMAADPDAPPPFNPNEPRIRKGLEDVYRGLMASEAEVYALFTGGMQHRHCYRTQLFDAFPQVKFTKRLRLEYFEANDHHLEWPPHREFLLDKVVDWISSAPFRRPVAPPGGRRQALSLP